MSVLVGLVASVIVSPSTRLASRRARLSASSVFGSLRALCWIQFGFLLAPVFLLGLPFSVLLHFLI